MTNQSKTTADVVQIPSLGFIRGTVVRFREGVRPFDHIRKEAFTPHSPNLLVVRGLDTTTVVIGIEGDEGGSLRLREVATRDLVEVLGNG